MSAAPSPHPHQAVLDRLVAMGAEIAEALHGQIMAEARTPEPDAARQKDLVASFEQVGRGIRRSVMLAQRLAADTLAPIRERAFQRRQIIRELENQLDDLPDRERAAALEAELKERLDSPDLDEELGTRRIAMIIGTLQRDMGLPIYPDPPHRRRTPADVTRLHDLARSTPPRPRTAPPHRPRPDTS